MNGGAYILTVTAAAMAVAILRKLAGEGTGGKLLHLLGGIFMALTILSPLLKIQLPDPGDWFAAFAQEGEAAAAAGAELGEKARGEIIITRTAAYIRDKAAALGIRPEVEVDLSENLIPCAVTLRGTISPDIRDDLTRIIIETLDLEEEAVRWISEK